MKSFLAGDVTLHYVDEGNGAPIVLVHGFPLDHQMWHQQIADLSRDYRVLAPDLRGFGRSDVTEGTVSMADFADDLAAMIDAAQISEPVTLCGLSMGGYIAWQFWLRHRQRLAKLILCDTRAAADTDEVGRARRILAERVVQDGTASIVGPMVEKLFAPQTLAELPAVVAAQIAIMNNTLPTGVAAAARGMAERPDMTEQLSEIDLPTLVICGQHDAITTVDEMRSIADALPNGTFTSIPSAGHLAPLENASAVNAAIRDFL